jgi:hypothetical protein
LLGVQDRHAAAYRELEFEPITLVPTAAAFALSGLLHSGGGDAFQCSGAGAVLGGVPAPGLGAVSAALVVAVQQGRNTGGQKLMVGACGHGVHGAGAVVAGENHPEALGGGVFGAAVHLIDALAGAAAVLVGFVDRSREAYAQLTAPSFVQYRAVPVRGHRVVRHSFRPRTSSFRTAYFTDRHLATRRCSRGRQGGAAGIPGDREQPRSRWCGSPAAGPVLNHLPLVRSVRSALAGETLPLLARRTPP